MPEFLGCQLREDGDCHRPPNRYQVLNPSVIPQGLGPRVLLGSINLDVNEYKIGQ